MASFAKLLFKKRQTTTKQQMQQESGENPQKLVRGKQRTASFRLPLSKRQSPPEIDRTKNSLIVTKSAAVDDSHLAYKSPYEVLTEPKKKHGTRSCPGGERAFGPSTSAGQPQQHPRKYSPTEATIHELSGSYENFPTMSANAQNNTTGNGRNAEEWEERSGNRKKEEVEKGGMGGGGPTKLRGAAAQAQRRGDQQQQQGAQQNQRHPRTCAGRMCTSEYGSGSAEPSPINEQQFHQQQQLAAPDRRRNALLYSGGPLMAQKKRPRGMMTSSATTGAAAADSFNWWNESSEEEDSSADEEDSLSQCFVQFWQHQVKVLKKEARTYREAAEKYRNKYHRMKAKGEELGQELDRQRERNVSMFNQLLMANQRIVQLSAHFHQQRQHNQHQHHFQQQNYAANAPAAGHPLPAQTGPGGCPIRTAQAAGQSMQINQQQKNGGDQQSVLQQQQQYHQQQQQFTTNFRERPFGGAGEAQCSTGEIGTEQQQAPFEWDNEELMMMAAEGASASNGKQEHLKTPTPVPEMQQNCQDNCICNLMMFNVPAEGAGYNSNNNAINNNANAINNNANAINNNNGIIDDGNNNGNCSLLNLSLFQHLHENAALFTGQRLNPPNPRSSRVLYNSGNDDDEWPTKNDFLPLNFEHPRCADQDQLFLLNESFPTDESVIVPLRSGESEFEFEEDEEEDDNACALNLDEAAAAMGNDVSIMRFSCAAARRHSYSSDDLSAICKGVRKEGRLGTSSSDDDMTKLWTKQLIKRGERVVFRPPRKTFCPSAAGEDSAVPNKFFRRFGKLEREALAKFDYLREEKSDLSGLASSPEKTN